MCLRHPHSLMIRVYAVFEWGRYRVPDHPDASKSLLAICVGIEHRIVATAGGRECKLCGCVGLARVPLQPKCDPRSSNGEDVPPATTAEPTGGNGQCRPLAAMSPAGCVHQLVEEARRRKEQ